MPANKIYQLQKGSGAVAGPGYEKGGVKYGVSNPRLGSGAKAPDVGLWAKSPATELLLSDYRPNVACNFT